MRKLLSALRDSHRVRNLEYKSTAMNDFMPLMKHCTQVLIVGAHCRIHLSCTFADSDVMTYHSEIWCMCIHADLA